MVLVRLQMEYLSRAISLFRAVGADTSVAEVMASEAGYNAETS
jgi:hypothetical protein